MTTFVVGQWVRLNQSRIEAGAAGSYAREVLAPLLGEVFEVKRVEAGVSSLAEHPQLLTVVANGTVIKAISGIWFE